MLFAVEAATAGRVVERWFRVAGERSEPCAPAPDGGADPAAPTGGVPLRVDVVAMPELAAALAGLSSSVWEVHDVEGDRSVSAAADAVVLEAPGRSRVMRVRRAAPRARLIATFRGPAPGPAREEALRAGVDGCVHGSSAAVVASYLTYVTGPLAAPPPDREGSDVGRRPG